MIAKGTPLTEPCPSFQPSIYDVLSLPIPTSRHIPAPCRQGFSETLGNLLTRVAQRPTWEALYGLFVLPKLVLQAGRRRVKAHVKQQAIDIGRRLEMFHLEKFDQLWAEASLSNRAKPAVRTRLQMKQGDHDLSPGTVEVIRGLVEEGALAKAAKHLVSRGAADTRDPGVAAKLRELHPTGPEVKLGGDSPLPSLTDPQFSDWAPAALQAVASFPPGSAAGPSGLRPCHLKECLRRPGSCAALQNGLGAFVEVACSGKLPQAFAVTMCASNLLAINKKDGGIRPIAIGDTLRRVVGKTLLHTPEVKSQLSTLQPRQCGVGVPYACEMVGMGVQAIATAHPTGNWVMLQVDMKNAFNNISRVSMLQSGLAKVPATYNWLAWCYQNPCPLFSQGQLLAQSKAGVHQGDAMGPIGFALGLDSALDKCLEEEKALDWVSWYLDDGTVVGSLGAVGRYLDKLIPALRDVGLEVNLGKCQIWGPGVQHDGDAAIMGLEDDSPLCHIPIAPFSAEAGITVLGVPVDVPGSVASGERKWEAATDATIDLLTKLRSLPDGQLRHCLLRHCLDACRVTHLMRSVCRGAAVQSSARLSLALRGAIADVVGCGLTSGSWEQATIPISKGGLGVRDPETCWPAARVAAIVGFHSRATSLIGLPDQVASLPIPDAPEVIERLSSLLGPNHDPVSRWVSSPSALVHADSSYAKQAWWAEQVAEARRARLPTLGTARDHVRLLNQEGPFASSWLSAIPNRALNNVLQDTDFRSLCRFWLGLPLLPEGVLLPNCPECMEAVDAFGDHFVTCRKNGSTRRHNALRDAWARVLSTANIRHSIEVSVPCGDRPADILLLGWDKGTDVCVDLTISSPLSLDCFPLNIERAKRHLNEKEKDKKSKQLAQCEAMGWGHHPAAYSPWGGQGTAARSLLFEVLKRATADQQGWAKTQRILELRQNLSITLAREVAKQLSLRCRVLESLEAPPFEPPLT